MQATLEDFFKALRGSDLEISLNAQIDAARAVELVGWSDRTLLKRALGTTLAKTTADRALYDEAFDRFFRFSSFENMAAQGSPALRGSDAMAAQDPPDQDQDKQTATGSGGPGGCQGSGGQALSQLLMSGDSAALASACRKPRGSGLTDIWFFTQKATTPKNPAGHGTRPVDCEISDANARRWHPSAP